MELRRFLPTPVCQPTTCDGRRLARTPPSLLLSCVCVVGVGWGRCPVHVQPPAFTAAGVVVEAVTMLCSPVRPYVVVSHRSAGPPAALPNGKALLFDHDSHHAPPPAALNNEKMDSRSGRGGRKRNVFKGSVLVSILLESHPRRFRSRASAVRLARRLQREGYISSIFGVKAFEDSAQLYMWQDDDAARRHRLAMTSSQAAVTSAVAGGRGEDSAVLLERGEVDGKREERVDSEERGCPEKLDVKLIEDLKQKVLNRSEVYNIVTSYNTFFRELQQDFGDKADRQSECVGHLQSYPHQRHSHPPSSQHQGKRQHHQQRQQYHQHHLQHQKYPEPFQNREGDPRLQAVSQQQYQQEHPEHLQHQLGDPEVPSHLRTTRQHGQRVPQGSLINTPNNEQVYTSDIYQNPWDIKGENAGSTDSSLDTQTYFRTRDRNICRDPQVIMTSAVGAIGLSNQPHEQEDRPPDDVGVALTDRVKVSEPSERRSYEDVGCVAPHYPEDSIKPYATSAMSSRELPTSSVAASGADSGTARSRWSQETVVYSYSDNEKQLMEEMRRMKKEHQDVLRTYEGRVNKLMAKMHELRDIAEMLENSSSKSSPYGLLPARATILNILAAGTKFEDNDKKTVVSPSGVQVDVPPPLPPRPDRRGRIYPNKPIVHPRVRMRALVWSRIILGDSGQDEKQNTVWYGMQEPKLDTEEIEKSYSSPPDPAADDVTLLDDIYVIRERPKQQLLAMFETERSHRLLAEMKNLRCTLADVVGAMTSLDNGNLHQDSFAELLELLNSPRDLDRILQHVKRKGSGQLDWPEYLVFELSKLDHFRERLEFLRFKNKLLINLFEIDQQLRELTTACDELMNNLPLKSVLETVLAVGNYLNGASDRGQADGFRLDILNKLKDYVDRSKRGNLLELVMRTYCLRYEGGLDLVCPTRFRLPEPSNMRHAAQVSFDEIHKALRDLREELSQVRERLEVLYNKDSSSLTIALRVTSENFLTSAVEILAEEKRMLDDTKGHFWKTISYFCHGNRQSTPHEFFHIWATFLHDCKYYWKLAHRNIARDKFEHDFSTKCQLSCSSVPGFNNLKNKMIRTVATLRSDHEMLASRAQQLQHINNWIESIGRYTQEMTPQTPATLLDPFHVTLTASGQHDRRYPEQRPWQITDRWVTGDRPPSPKAITATPPKVHKPQPVLHAGPPTASSASYSSTFPVAANANDGLHYNRQHPNDADAEENDYECLTKSILHAPEGEELTHDAGDGACMRGSQEIGGKKNPNFLLKTLLKREPRQGGSCDELATHTGPPQSRAATATPFNKLRNTVVQRLAGSGSSKKTGDVRTPVSDVHRDARTPASDVPRKPPRAHVDGEFTPSHQILFHLRQAQQYADDVRHTSLDTAERHSRDLAIQDSVLHTATNATRCSLSPSKHEGARPGETARPRDTSSERSGRHKNTDGCPAVPGHVPSTGSVQSSPHKGSRPRNRAPIALGSNISISDAYDRTDGVRPPQNGSNSSGGVVIASSENSMTVGAYVPSSMSQPSNADSKWVKAQPVPVYKAKLIPNYENQTKLDPRLEHGIRGQAEPVLQPPPHISHLPQASTSSDVYRQELQRKSEMYLGLTPSQLPHTPGAKVAITASTGEEEHAPIYVNDIASSRSVADTQRKGGQSEQARSFGAYFASAENFGAPSNQPLFSARKEDTRGRNGKGREGSRERSADAVAVSESHEVPPRVSALIDRWEKQTTDEPAADGQDKAPSMTSTPVTRRKHPASRDEWTGASRPPRPDDQTPGKLLMNGVSSFPHSMAVSGRPHRQKTPHRQQQGDNQQEHHHQHQHQDLHPQAYKTLQQQQQQQPTGQFQYTSQHPLPSTNTYPPRASHTPARHPNDNSSTADIPGSYGEPRWTAAPRGGVGDEGNKPSDRARPVPLPRHNIPGALAVVKPTVMHQGSLTFMEI